MYEERDDEDARLLAAGEHTAVIARYFPVVETRVRARIRGVEADDVVANVLLRLWTELQRGRRYSVPFRVVVHNVIGWTIKAHFEALKGRPVSLPDDYDVPGGQEVEYDDSLGPVLARLTEHERTVFELRAFLGWTAKQVAEALGIEPNAVDQTYHRAKGKLRRLLEE